MSLGINVFFLMIKGITITGNVIGEFCSYVIICKLHKIRNEKICVARIGAFLSNHLKKCMVDTVLKYSF